MWWMENKQIFFFLAWMLIAGMNVFLLVWCRKISRQRNDAVERVIKQENEIVQLRNLALHDYLTGLPNRALLEDRIQQALVKAGREQSKFTVIFLDVDRFKPVNDRYGHNIGDHLLRDVAMRIRNAIRASDTIARIGGDEFVILASVSCPTEPSLLLRKIDAVMAAPFHIGDQAIPVSVSMGDAVFPDDGKSLEELLWKADLAMYSNKKIKNKASMFVKEMSRH